MMEREILCMMGMGMYLNSPALPCRSNYTTSITRKLVKLFRILCSSCHADGRNSRGIFYNRMNGR